MSLHIPSVRTETKDQQQTHLFLSFGRTVFWVSLILFLLRRDRKNEEAKLAAESEESGGDITHYRVTDSPSEEVEEHSFEGDKELLKNL